MKRLIVSITLLGLVVIPFALSAQPFMYVPSGEGNDIIIIDLNPEMLSLEKTIDFGKGVAHQMVIRDE